MKIHSVLINGVLSALEEIFFTGRYADKVIEYVLRQHPKWGSRDRGFVASSTYDIVRHKRYLMHLSRLEKLETSEDLRNLLEIYLLWKNGDRLPDQGIRNHDASEPAPGIKYSFPDWFVEILKADYGDVMENILISMNREASVVLRTNTLKCSRSQLQHSLQEESISTKPLSVPQALELSARKNVFQTKAFKLGWFEVQDTASQEVGHFLQSEPGMQVIDACAGAGGKSLHLSALSKGKGRVLSMDVEAHKLEILKKRARRGGCGNIETRIITDNKVIKRLASKADRVLLDVPCSGSGVIRRNPDSKWKLSPEMIEDLKIKQYQILSQYAQMVKPGGKLVYATCSIFKQENEAQVTRFLSENDAFVLEIEQTLLPNVYGYDGFYMARMKRKDSWD